MPFVIYADFECFTNLIQGFSQNPEYSFTEKYQKHTPSGYCSYFKADDSMGLKITDNFTVCSASQKNKNTSEQFVQDLEAIPKNIY